MIVDAAMGVAVAQGALGMLQARRRESQPWPNRFSWFCANDIASMHSGRGP